eukprot:CAMPEP_0118869448 /NCGR_PEP_ID=MMETSP1163-20130328/12782_1 /TAXON_ID=124430 /ORGANISM="Phaeomonas parva, Strain CCMP2877" /LENGTH=135 /DNA_ID=CAMNT_0006804343 /DNA_START=220 /DNA_END=623 /DNA_ORIENTATION=-
MNFLDDMPHDFLQDLLEVPLGDVEGPNHHQATAEAAAASSRMPDSTSYRRKKARAKLCRKMLSDGFAELHMELAPMRPGLKASDRPGLVASAVQEIRRLKGVVKELETAAKSTTGKNATAKTQAKPTKAQAPPTA